MGLYAPGLLCFCQRAACGRVRAEVFVPVVVCVGGGLRAEGSHFLQGHPTPSSALIREAEQ